MGIEDNIVTKSGSFFSYGNERLGQGRGNAKASFDEHPAMAQEIREKIFKARKLSPEGMAIPVGDTEEPIADTASTQESPIAAVPAPPEREPRGSLIDTPLHGGR